MSKRIALLFDRHVAMSATPLLNTRNCPAKTVGSRFLLDHPVPTPGPRPIVGETQQVERPFAVRVGRRIWASSSRRAEVDHPGLGWVQGQTVLAKSLWQYGQHPARILFVAKAQHGIIGIADQDCPALQPRLDVPFEPCIEDFVQEDVRPAGVR